MNSSKRLRKKEPVRGCDWLVLQALKGCSTIYNSNSYKEKQAKPCYSGERAKHDPRDPNHVESIQ